MEEEGSVPSAKRSNVAIDHEKLDADVEQLTAKGLQGSVTEAIEGLLSLEKQMRLAGEVSGARKVVLAILNLCKDTGKWQLLNEQIQTLAKRRAQLKQVVTAMVQQAMTFIDVLPDSEREAKVELIKTLSSVTAGKIFVEIERARLVQRLAKMREEEGKVKEAAELMQEVAVETFGAMAKSEKIAFILEQVRLCLDHGDFMKAQILSKKINPKSLNEAEGGGAGEGRKRGEKDEAAMAQAAAAADVPPLHELKRKYYHLMIRYYRHTGDYLEICRCFKSIYETPAVQNDPQLWPSVLRSICWFAVLAPHGPMQSSLLHATSADKRLNELPAFKDLLRCFTSMEAISWPAFSSRFAAEQAAAAAIFGGEGGEKAAEDLRLRVIEHNIIVVSTYYSRITLARLAQLLDLSTEGAEKHLADMVVSNTVGARIDRPAGIVTFSKNAGEAIDNGQVLNSWASNISKLLDLVETSCHQIHKEAMVHKVSLKA